MVALKRYHRSIEILEDYDKKHDTDKLEKFNEINKEFDEFFQSVKKKQATRFAFHKYPAYKNKITEEIIPRVLLKIDIGSSNGEKREFTARMTEKEYYDLFQKGYTTAYFSGIFRESYIKGDITMDETMHDAIPTSPSLKKAGVFTPHKTSPYWDKEKDFPGDDYPRGLHYGQITYSETEEIKKDNGTSFKSLEFRFRDVNKELPLKPTFFIQNLDFRNICDPKNPLVDPWGRDSIMLGLSSFEPRIKAFF